MIHGGSRSSQSTFMYSWQSSRVSRPKPQHKQTLLVVGFVKEQHLVQFGALSSRIRVSVLFRLLNRKYVELFVATKETVRYRRVSANGGLFCPSCFGPWKGFQNPGNFCFWNPALDSGIRLKESGIPLTIGIRNPRSTDKKSGIQYQESGIHSVESRI